MPQNSLDSATVGSSQAPPQEVPVLQEKCHVPGPCYFLSQEITFPIPTAVSELHDFLGLASYYWMFGHHFAESAGHLYCLFDKDSHTEWTEQCQAAFSILKRKLSSGPILAFPHLKDTFIIDILDMDANNCGTGGVLSKKYDEQERAITYGSHTLTKRKGTTLSLVRNAGNGPLHQTFLLLPAWVFIHSQD